MIDLYKYLDENRSDRHGIETVDKQIEEQRVELLQRAKVFFADKDKPFDEDLLRTIALVLGYDDGIGIIHKIHSPSYSRDEIIGIIESRLDIRNDVKKGQR